MTRRMNMGARRKAIAAIMSAVQQGRMKFVFDARSGIPGERFWISDDDSYCTLRERGSGYFEKIPANAPKNAPTIAAIPTKVT